MFSGADSAECYLIGYTLLHTRGFKVLHTEFTPSRGELQEATINLLQVGSPCAGHTRLIVIKVGVRYRAHSSA